MQDPLQKHTLNLFEGDFEELQALFPDIGASAAIRQLVRNAILRAKANDATNHPDVQVKL